MDITFINGCFAVGMFARFEYSWNKRDGSLSVWSKGKEASSVHITTNRGDFVEAINKADEVVANGGDGNWLYVPIGKAPITLRAKPLPKIVLTKVQMQKKRKTVTRYLLSDAPYSLDLPDTLEGVIGWMQTKLKEVPAPCRRGAQFSFGTTMEYGETYPRIEITYQEPETDKELLRRLQVDAERSRIQEANERAQLDKLKSKFGAEA